jgi:RNA polymerase sigma-70 factor (ECF subfamily)
MSSPSSRPLVPALRLAPPATLGDRLRAHDRDAARELFDRHADKVERAVGSVMGFDDDVQDVVQDAFVAALDGIAGFRGDDDALGPWVRVIGVRLALKKLRWRRTRQWFGWAGSAHVPRLIGPARTDTQAALVRAHAVLEQLPVGERVAFGLRFIEGLRLEEVAEAIGVSLATTKRRLRDARARFSALAASDALLRDWIDEPEGPDAPRGEDAS